jgi:hypothetical protein
MNISEIINTLHILQLIEERSLNVEVKKLASEKIISLLNLIN